MKHKPFAGGTEKAKGSATREREREREREKSRSNETRKKCLIHEMKRVVDYSLLE